MSTSVRPIPEGYHSLSVALTCKNAASAMDFYKRVFHASELVRMPGPGGQIMHADMKIGDSHIFLNDEIPGMATAPTPGSSTGVYVFLYTEDVDAVYKRAIAEGCQVTMPLADQFWGDRYGKFGPVRALLGRGESHRRRRPRRDEAATTRNDGQDE